MLSNDVIWLIIAVFFLTAEVLTGGFWLVFFGAGALATSLAAWQGWLDGTNAQILLFLLTSAATLLIFRIPMIRWLDRKSPHTKIGDSAGQEVTVLTEIPAGGTGRVEFQGSSWDARTRGGEPVSAGAKARIVKQDGTRLIIEKTE